jgi:DNA polymerase I-like protein with 3'-5' exonuclease and polymerase domains
VEKKELDTVKMIVKEKMEEAVKLKVPIQVTVKTGKNWLEVN